MGVEEEARSPVAAGGGGGGGAGGGGGGRGAAQLPHAPLPARTPSMAVMRSAAAHPQFAGGGLLPARTPGMAAISHFLPKTPALEDGRKPRNARRNEMVYHMILSENGSPIQVPEAAAGAAGAAAAAGAPAPVRCVPRGCALPLTPLSRFSHPRHLKHSHTRTLLSAAELPLRALA
jgi:hypothetical protein